MYYRSIARSLLLSSSCFTLLACFATASLFCAAASAQFDEPKGNDGRGVRFGEERVFKWQAGVKIEANQGPVSGLYVTFTVPTDWPEQQVQVIDTDVTPNCGEITTRQLNSGVMQMIINGATIRAGEEGHILVTMKVTTHVLLPPTDTSTWQIPKKAPKDVLPYLSPSSFIDSRQSKVRDKAKELTKDVESDWAKVEAIHDWVRDNVKLEEGELKGTVDAIKDGRASAEEIVSVFVALCRAAKVPARMVWVQGHFYAEFYLQEKDAKKGGGAWFPAELIGARNFGGLANPKPILQKGDSIDVPEYKEPQRFVPELVKGKKGGGRPSVTFVRDLLAND